MVLPAEEVREHGHGCGREHVSHPNGKQFTVKKRTSSYYHEQAPGGAYGQLNRASLSWLGYLQRSRLRLFWAGLHGREGTRSCLRHYM